jgi:hypothetical protein
LATRSMTGGLMTSLVRSEIGHRLHGDGAMDRLANRFLEHLPLISF